MKAIVQDRYGSPDVLEFGEVEKPVAVSNLVLVRARASSVNAYDWHVMRGDPYLARLMLPAAFGRKGPKARIRGRDFAGRVEAVGPEVTRFSPGDEVYGDLGDANGAFAEYVCAPEDLVELKPINLTFEQAAAIPLAGSTALFGLRDVAKVEAGQRVLVNGASGGVGTFAVQLAKTFGAKVTGVCSTRNVDLVRSLGADHVIDYGKEDFTRNGGPYDVVLDLVANRSLADLRRCLTPSGTLVLSGGGTFTGGSVVGPMRILLQAKLQSRFVRHCLIDFSTPLTLEHLTTLKTLAESSQLTPAIDRSYALADVPAAITYLETHHAQAKVTITI
ncbi:NADPH:quinone reductase-like Zn-dependent oxidoreductase [Kribbella orskensis]|uniref:NADPH:quinone reductase-like Zn-dependent oxidoreductase n=1 Tax=Kribbella orskensis TaxID=2512216 RepID=A0ABY2BBL6_9ACTN|nr:MULTISPECIES: NAD(P)-dependent alcohol dehydrogenase [Kribbella]TCN33551.1 NADPH:quinone reductase-like Zn-dependent oxidoreductase [Kribbella sp. VKM Ac-2500]TCO14042.1 NADPH:quinone reductase-like Zn-dependent oxidoreductase [Kribbella orskensis]